MPSKGKSPLASETSSSAAEVLAQFYSFESFLDPIKVMQQANGADLPRTPDPEHSKLVAVPPLWSVVGPGALPNLKKEPQGRRKFLPSAGNSPPHAQR